jgi:hypothetical protein
MQVTPDVVALRQTLGFTQSPPNLQGHVLALVASVRCTQAAAALHAHW